MQTLDFLQAFHDYSVSNGFSFYFDDKAFEQPGQASGGSRLLIKIAVGAALGPLAVANSGFYANLKNDAFAEEIRKLKSHCDLLGMKQSLGAFVFNIALVGDGIPDETLIGRAAVIHGVMENLNKYSMTMLKTRFSEAKAGVMSSMFMVFSSHKSAKSFFGAYAKRCYHRNRNVHLFPSVVDLEDQEINYAGSSIFGLSYWKSQADKTAEHIFGKQK